jgi:hypothetical protein
MACWLHDTVAVVGVLVCMFASVSAAESSASSPYIRKSIAAGEESYVSEAVRVYVAETIVAAWSIVTLLNRVAIRWGLLLYLPMGKDILVKLGANPDSSTSPSSPLLPTCRLTVVGVGLGLTLALGETDGEILGLMLGLRDTDGDTEGLIDGDKLGLRDGDKLTLGETDGEILGLMEGEMDGERDGERLILGETLGLMDTDGLTEGEMEGEMEGETEGLADVPTQGPSAKSSASFNSKARDLVP